MENLIVYDNTIRPNEIIRDIIGEKGFGNVIVKRKQLMELYEKNMKIIFQSFKWIIVNTFYDIELIVKQLEKYDKKVNIKVLHCFSDYVITDVDKLGFTYQKLPFISEPIIIKSKERRAAIMFHEMAGYLDFLKDIVDKQDTEASIREYHFSELETEGLGNIENIGNFIQCITGNFDSRYFNMLQGNEYCIRKSSKNIKKIKSEYQYFQLLPEQMKRWFVMPFNYFEVDHVASYEMERLHMANIAIKWVHGSIGEKEFIELMDMYFYFFQERVKRVTAKEQYWMISNLLYEKKVEERIADIKAMPEFNKIANLLLNNEQLQSIDHIYERYLKLKSRVEKMVTYDLVSVIGHGDPCFANAMYNRSTRTLKFIDPKGALTEEELWTNPYYDIAKLSHSVCGLYDFFNNAMFDIMIDDNFDYLVKIPFNNSLYKRIFRQKVEDNGYDYLAVRIYEASLFLSMLPLHMDYPHKVFGFILNAVNILKEVEEYV